MNHFLSIEELSAWQINGLLDDAARLLPPLNVTDVEVDQALAILHEVLKSF